MKLRRFLRSRVFHGRYTLETKLCFVRLAQNVMTGIKFIKKTRVNITLSHTLFQLKIKKLTQMYNSVLKSSMYL